ncbi:hypothetical protein [Pseudooceanicola aestuarii]|uniref:hypothetical protein n=1 Tax=Pseudooceanicola aestuarii TaxID=2697319 RepID=UPI0013D5A696|nr:hypothetical protein [Pseudooceanicola aestuarii]
MAVGTQPEKTEIAITSRSSRRSSTRRDRPTRYADIAADLLLNAGFLQELGALIRQIEETCEDIVFLYLGTREETLPPLHERFLAAFYGQELVEGAPTGRPDLKKGEVPRKKVRAYLDRMGGTHSDRNTWSSTGLVLQKAFSGFVHGSSLTIMEMCGGCDPKFYVRGLSETSHQNKFAAAMPGYSYKSLMATFLAVSAFGKQPSPKMEEFLEQFERLTTVNAAN